MIKRFSCLIVVICLLLAGCGYFGSNIRQPVACYYPRREVTFGNSNNVIASEAREGSGHISDLNYLLSMYLQGPKEPELYSPFPEGTQLLEATQVDDTLQLVLSDRFQHQPEYQVSLACVCLSMTVFDLNNIQNLEITLVNQTNDSKRTYSFTRESLLLEDLSEYVPEATAQEE